MLLSSDNQLVFGSHALQDKTNNTYADQNVVVFEAGAALAQAGNQQRSALRRARSG